jgi:hypothetical protein
MKFGQYLIDHQVAEWGDNYIHYNELKRMIRVLAELEKTTMAASPGQYFKKGISLTVPPPTNAAAQPAERKATTKSPAHHHAPSEGGDHSDGKARPALCQPGMSKRKEHTRESPVPQSGPRSPGTQKAPPSNHHHHQQHHDSSGVRRVCGVADEEVENDGNITHETFFSLLDEDIRKVQSFTHLKVGRSGPSQTDNAKPSNYYIL